MSDKVFIVSHRRARQVLTVHGKNLKEALEKEGLDPSIWEPVADTPIPEAPTEPPDNPNLIPP